MEATFVTMTEHGASAFMVPCRIRSFSLNVNG